MTALLNAILLFVLAFINPRGFGLGDVKLGLSTGAALGWLAGGWAGVVYALLGTAVGFVLFGLTSVALLVSGKAGRDTDIAFGPFMVAGCFWRPPRSPCCCAELSRARARWSTRSDPAPAARCRAGSGRCAPCSSDP
ncbi:hypothetical protein G7085_04165 [Tessaracoccus sp. HDW20]|uniref:hypothetical protein n=1 Tax=Tessaracoccus coleopterorum TaxID=2714950 RepID=UPI0018D4A20D|nr:hypothetical protein [Tessaracoccus coleopterorum]NHB84107.1 hypothetical protein [Tessaracoccus coleopterorum]